MGAPNGAGLWDFILIFRRHWFAAMSGGASVPFAALAVFLDNIFAHVIFASCAVTGATFAAYRPWRSERERVLELEERLKAKIDVLTGAVTELPDTDGDKFSKWAQITVSCATDEQLANCEVRLKSLVRTLPTKSKELVEEHVHCNWSQTPDRTISIYPGLPRKANLFSLLKGSPNIGLELDPPKLTLRTEIQKPGTYQGVIVITAGGGVRQVEKTFQFEWQDYDNISLGLL